MLRGLCVSVCFYGGAWVCRDVWGVLYACLYVCVHVDTHPKCRDVCVCVCVCVCRKCNIWGRGFEKWVSHGEGLWEV